MTHTGPDGVNKRTWLGRFLRVAVDPFIDYIYYRLDLNGFNGKPSHSKVLSTVAFGIGCVGIITFGPVILQLCKDEKAGCYMALGFFLAYAAFVFALPFGLAGYKTWAATKGGGTVEAFGSVATEAAKHIAARRQQGDGTFEASP